MQDPHVSLLAISALIAGCATPPGDTGCAGAGCAATDLPPSRVYVTLVAHNEDTQTGNNPQCVEFFDNVDTRWQPNRDALVAIADLVEEQGAAFDLQTDMEFIDVMLDQGESEADNVLRSLAERPSGRIAIDAHAHEGVGKNYADVANRVERVSGARNGIVGGFTAATCESTDGPPDWEKFWSPLAPEGPGPEWQATALTDGASAGHRCDPAVAGVWRPAGHDEYFTHDPSAPLPSIGTGLGGSGLVDGLAAVQTLVADLREGRLEDGRMYTTSVTILHCEFDRAGSGNTPADVAAFIDGVQALDDGSGDIVWATFPQILETWQAEYDSQSSLWQGAAGR